MLFQQRASIITLGVRDLKASEHFYSHILGWKKQEESNDNIIFYALNQMLLALFPDKNLADDANISFETSPYHSFTLVYNTFSEEDVDRIFATLKASGVTIVKAPEKAFWGGYSGYFADPNGHLWEVAFNPFLQLNPQGHIITGDDITIAHAQKEDVATIFKLQKESYRQEADIYSDCTIPPLTQTYNDVLKEWQSGVMLKAMKGGQIIGSVRAYASDEVCKIGKLIVKPECQNLGIGRQLMCAIEAAFDNCEAYELFTGHKSEKNLAFYQKLGYTITKECVESPQLTIIYFRKDLQ